ncbi:hypothetical protein BH581_22725 [Vibrio splendidus]|jgi:hypothetical protein|nr:hypothetical protein BH581_22725 [Vibrio splendidus]
MFTAEKVIAYVRTAKLVRDRYLIFYPKFIKYENWYHYAVLSLNVYADFCPVNCFESVKNFKAAWNYIA